MGPKLLPKPLRGNLAIETRHGRGSDCAKIISLGTAVKGYEVVGLGA
jgi:hypothetical protein